MEAQMIASGVSDMPPPGGKGILARPGGASNTELRAAFENTMATLLGMLNPEFMGLPPSISMAADSQPALASAEAEPPGQLPTQLFPLQAGKPSIPTGHVGQEAGPTAPPKPGQGEQPISVDTSGAGSGDPVAQIYGQVMEGASQKGNSLQATGIDTPQAMLMNKEQTNPLPGHKDVATHQTSTLQIEQNMPLGANGESPVLTGVGHTTAQTKPDSSTKVAQPSPMEQIAERVRISIDRDEQGATIQLYPKELGKVHIRMELQNGQLHLSIRAEQHDTGRLLDGKLTELRQNLAEHGIKLGELSVASAGRPSQAEGNAREAAQVTRAFQMNMNPDTNSQSHRQPGWAGGFYGDPQSGSQRQRTYWNGAPEQPGSATIEPLDREIVRPRWTVGGLANVDTYV